MVHPRLDQRVDPRKGMGRRTFSHRIIGPTAKLVGAAGPVRSDSSLPRGATWPIDTHLGVVRMP